MIDPSGACCGSPIHATMPPEALELTAKFMKDPLRILVPAEELKLDGIKQFRVDLQDDRARAEPLADVYKGARAGLSSARLAPTGSAVCALV